MDIEKLKEAINAVIDNDSLAIDSSILYAFEKVVEKYEELTK